jgi:hypothetical protein
MPTMGIMGSSFMRSLVFQSTAIYLPSSMWILLFLLFIPNKVGDLIQQQPESREIIGWALAVIPGSKRVEPKPPCVYPGCSNHTYSNNLLIR